MILLLPDSIPEPGCFDDQKWFRFTELLLLDSIGDTKNAGLQVSEGEMMGVWDLGG